MRRWGPSSVASLVLVASGIAHAGPWVVTVEGGGEGDTNVQRVETGPGLDTHRVASGVVRLGGKLARRGKAWGGVVATSMGFLARLVSETEAATEDVALLAGDLRYLRPVEGRSLSVGLAIVAADAEPLTEPVGARTFTNLGADALLVLDGGEDRHLSVGLGVRDFTYKQNHDFDWRGPSATARLDLNLWQPSGGTRSLELAAYLGFELRAYESAALADGCMPEADASDSCSAPTSRLRRDRSQRIGLDVTYIGRVVAAVGYQLTVIDSNSYGQSLIRHKATISATTTLFAGLYGTALATLQIDQYPDGLVIKTDTQQSEFTSLDDENRSSVQIRIGRPISDAWSIEGRAAIWRNLGSDTETAFRRASLYAGAIYSR